MAIILKGNEIARTLTENLRQKADVLQQNGINPCLAIVRVGNRPDDLSYERGAIKRCEKIGITVQKVQLHENVQQNQLMAEIRALNQNKNVHGILMFQPLPKQLDAKKITAILDPAKDVDGITSSSLASVFSGTETGFAPCTAQACAELLLLNHIPITGKRAVVIGRSLVIGKPVSMLLLKENATVTICHSRTANLPQICREADILVVAAGKAQMIGAEFVRPGQVVLDVGIHMGADGKLCGDVRFDEVASIVAAITPVPGGVGSVTTSVLAEHVIKAAERTTQIGR